MPMDDPYYAVKEDVESALAKAQQLHTNLKRLVSSRSKSPSFGPTNTNTSNNTNNNNNNNNTAKELAWTQSELQSAVETIQADLGDVSAAVRIVAADPRRFGVDAAEVAQRTEFVARVRRHIDEFAATVAASRAPVPMAMPVMSHPATNSNLKKATPKPSRSASNNNNNNGNNNNNNADMFIGREQGMQQQIMRQQDEQLVGVMSTVGTLKEVAIVMNQELDDQTALLQDLDVQVEGTQDKMDMGMKRLKDFIQANAGDDPFMHHF
ncbi:Syntaxin-6 [Chytriomyces hyalinus]|nr:Syntaxin-6 [Chytriomyces hyalinus]